MLLFSEMIARGNGDLGSINASLRSEPEFITVQGVVTVSLAAVEDTTEGVGIPFRVLMTILLPLPVEASGIITARRFLPLRETLDVVRELEVLEEKEEEEFEDDDEATAAEQEMEADFL